MANKRMLNIQVIDSDNFMDMSATAQLLYFQLVLRADDDGFVGNPKMIMRMIGGNISDMQQLAQRKYIISFPSGVIVIRHWRLHNTIRKDTYHETIYAEEKSQLSVDENEIYVLNNQNFTDSSKEYLETSDNEQHPDTVTGTNQARCKSVTSPCQTRNETETQIRLDKTRLDKSKKEKAQQAAPTPRTTMQFFEALKGNYDFSERMQQELGTWFKYKTERREPYKEIGMKKFLTQIFHEIEKNGEDKVIDAFEWSMSNGWKGFYYRKEDKTQPRAKPIQYNNFQQRNYTSDDYTDLERKLANL